jgi:2-dehydropantoate 2-reductase
MRICVFGAGSLGSAVGGILAANNEVVLIGRQQHVRAVRQKGLVLTGSVSRRVRVEAYETVDEAGPPELLIITTKAYDTKEAVEICSDWAAPGTMVLTLQNGLGNLELLRTWKGKRAFGGTITMGASLTSPGRVRVSGLGSAVIGSDMDAGGAGLISRAFSSCGIPSKTNSNVCGEIWAKAIVNACINPTTAILEVPNGALLMSPSISRIVRDVCKECEVIADSSGVSLPYHPMISRVRAVTRETSKNRSSMLQDVELGRRTEINQINGIIAESGAMHGVPAPLNRALVAIVEAIGTRA